MSTRTNKKGNNKLLILGQGGIIMKKRQFTNGITFFTTPEMYEKLKGISDQNDVGISEFLRDIINEHLASCSEGQSCQHDSIISAEAKGDEAWKT